MHTRWYKWFYDHIHSKYYNFMVAWLLLPFGGEAKWRQRMIKPVSFKHHELILEMCCGTGGATVHISKLTKNMTNIIGMDLSSGQIYYAKKRTYICPINFIEGDVTKASFQNNIFDKVFITHAIHEMSRNYRLQTLYEARRVLKPRGELIVLELDNPPSLWRRILIGFWFLYWLPGNFETPTRRDMFKHGVKYEIQEAGFINVKKYSTHHGIFQTVIATK